MNPPDSQDHEWQTCDELPSDVMAWLQRRPGKVVAVIATVDADGGPRTAAFGALRPSSPHHVRFSCRRTHTTYANIVRDGRIMVSLYGPPDISVGIHGHARVLQEQLREWPDNAVIGIDVTLVKNDRLAWAPIASGITYDVPTSVAERLEALTAELADVESDPPRS